MKIPIHKSLMHDFSYVSGGRMSTARCPEDSSITADLGAQYISLTKEYSNKRQRSVLCFQNLGSPGIWP